MPRFGIPNPIHTPDDSSRCEQRSIEPARCKMKAVMGCTPSPASSSPAFSPTPFMQLRAGQHSTLPRAHPRLQHGTPRSRPSRGLPQDGVPGPRYWNVPPCRPAAYSVHVRATRRRLRGIPRGSASTRSTVHVDRGEGDGRWRSCLFGRPGPSSTRPDAKDSSLIDALVPDEEGISRIRYRLELETAT